MNHSYLIMLGALVVAIGVTGCGRDSGSADHDEQSSVVARIEEDDPHAGHDHGDDTADDAPVDDQHDHEQEADEGHDDEADEQDEHAEGDGHDHAADDPGSDAEEDHAGEELGHVELTADELSHLDLELARAGSGTIDRSAVFPGEIVANEDRVVHILPRAAGIVRAVEATLGDYVEEGQVLAWIESAELAQAKLDFYAARAEVGCCQIELPRAKEIFEATHKMLALLETEPNVEDLQQLDEAEMGEFRGKLVTAYAEYRASQKVFERERDLFAKSIASEDDYISAEASFKKAQAAFTAAKDMARFQSLVQYTEAAQKQQVSEFKAVSAEQHLRLLGVDEEAIEHLISLVPQASSVEPCLCDDPNCTEGEVPSVLEVLGNEDHLSWYAVRAPISGYLTEKHLVLGEKVGAEESIMVIVDTSSVWVRFSVYQKDMAHIRSGQHSHIEAGQGIPMTEGAIKYVAPFIDPHTRTAQARLEIPNPNGNLRPGLYVQVHVETDSNEYPVVIDKDAVQLLEEQDVVFIPEGDEFVAVVVTLGPADREMVSVLSGLEAGQRYVRHGAFELKAKIVTSGLDAHAGHGH